jgi:glycogen debranching enzyme
VHWIVEAMRHWVLNCGIDGFRFDLASIMGREENNGFNFEAPLLAAIENDPVLSTRILIAEPWDIGPGGYQLGNFPQNWFEWNDKFRDDVRRFWRGDPWSANAFATRMSGSADVFADKGKPSRSINFIAAHDGFTLHDLLHFTQKNNLSNGENNRDGKNHEVTCPGSEALALLSSLMLARGTPMLTAGDEFGRTQGGNNNAYAQDNETTWLDWINRDTKLEKQFSELLKLRTLLSDVIKDEFLTGENSDVEWQTATGEALDWSKENIRSIAMVLNGSQRRICVLYNADSVVVAFGLQPLPGRKWHNLRGAGLQCPAQSVMVFEERKESQLIF